jgi:hypothetical protein
MHSLQEQLREYIAAAFPGIWITSFEHDDAIREIAALCKQEQWSLAVWDVDKGLQVGAAAVGPAPDPSWPCFAAGKITGKNRSLRGSLNFRIS